jgi:hypothetical protein
MPLLHRDFNFVSFYKADNKYKKKIKNKTPY